MCGASNRFANLLEKNTLVDVMRERHVDIDSFDRLRPRLLQCPTEETLMLRKVFAVDLPHPGPAPLKYAGEWVAWNKSLTEIIAHGHNVANVRADAIASGHPDAVLERVRHPARFIGAR